MERQIADQGELLAVLRGEIQWEHHKRQSWETRRLRSDLKKTKRALRRAAGWVREITQEKAKLRAELTALQSKMLERTWESEHTSEEEGGQDAGGQDVGINDADGRQDAGGQDTGGQDANVEEASGEQVMNP